jgi:hypothetical protein
MTHHPHHITHIELSAQDAKAASEFYKACFDWEIKAFPEMDYYTFTAEGGSGGGFNKVSDEQPAGTVMVYINTEDLKGSLEKIRKNGGTVLLESYDIPTVGTMATFKDPTGNLMALLQPLPME